MIIKLIIKINFVYSARASGRITCVSRTQYSGLTSFEERKCKTHDCVKIGLHVQQLCRKSYASTMQCDMLFYKIQRPGLLDCMLYSSARVSIQDREDRASAGNSTTSKKRCHNSIFSSKYHHDCAIQARANDHSVLFV